MASLYNTYRPKKLSDVIGQDNALASLRKLLEKGNIPQAILLSGPSGVGKTTIARILKKNLQCGDNDFMERNCADFRGIDDIREIRKHVAFAPISGRVRIWLIDECHKLTNDAQNVLLKMLEDPPQHAYFMLATTEPQKIIKAIHTRCSQIKLGAISADVLQELVERVAKQEGMEIDKEVAEEIVDASDGSARKALVILEQIGGIEGKKAQIASIQSTAVTKDAAIDLARMLLNSERWSAVAAKLKALSDEDVEGIRYLVLAYMRAVLLGGGKLAPRAYQVIDAFSRNMYDSKQAGLAAACYEVTNGQPKY